MGDGDMTSAIVAVGDQRRSSVRIGRKISEGAGQPTEADATESIAPPRPMESKSEGKYDSDDDAKGSGGAKDGGDAKGSSSGGGALIRKVFDYYTDSKDLEDEVRRFVFANCKTFGAANGEYELEHTEIYNDFKTLLERKLEGFIERCGASVGDFYEAVAANEGRGMTRSRAATRARRLQHRLLE